MVRPAPGPAADVEFRCGAAARWLPRALGGAILAAALLAAYRLTGVAGPVGEYVRPFIAVAGALAALVIVRQGAELRQVIVLTGDALVLRLGTRSRSLRFVDMQRLDYAAPFATSRRWLPAAVVTDDRGTDWRVPAVVEDGDRLVSELLRRADRHDLRAWEEARKVRRRMAAASRRVGLGYAVAAVVLVVAVAYYFH